MTGGANGRKKITYFPSSSGKNVASLYKESKAILLTDRGGQ
jgi:hypothetical protein